MPDTGATLPHWTTFEWETWMIMVPLTLVQDHLNMVPLYLYGCHAYHSKTDHVIQNTNISYLPLPLRCPQRCNHVAVGLDGPIGCKVAWKCWVCQRLVGMSLRLLLSHVQLGLGSVMWTGCSKSTCAGLSLATEVVSVCSPMSMLNVWWPGWRTLKGPL